MKLFKSILNFIFEKMLIITMSLIMFLLINYLDSSLFIGGVSERQMFLGIMGVIMMPLMMVLMIHSNGPGSSNSRGWKIFNHFCGVLIFCGGLFLLNDLKERPYRHRDTSLVYSLSESDFSVITEFPNRNILTCAKSKVKYDSIHPLKIYEAYKIDIFFKRTAGQFCIKSDLMKDYVFLYSPNNGGGTP